MNSKSTNALYYSSIVAIGGFLFGFDATVISGVLGYVTTEFNLGDYEQGLVVGAPTLTGILAALTVSPLADRFGRKNMLIVLACVYSISAIFSALAQSFEMLVLARAVGGYAFGSLGLAPIYIAEISPAKKRGFMVSVNQLNIVIGFSVAYFANYIFFNISGWQTPWVTLLSIDTNTWRWMLGLEALPALIWLCALFYVPESPRWLYLKGRIDEAKSIMSRITPEDELEHALTDIAASTTKRSMKFLEQLSQLFSKRMRFPLIIGIIIAIAQQTSGINAVYFYAPTIFEQSGVGTDAAFVQSIWIGIINVVVTVCAMLLIDRVGRKPMMVAGLMGIIVSLSLTAYGFNEATYTLDKESAASFASELDAPNLPLIADITYNSDTEFKAALRDHIGDQTFRANEARILNASMSANTTLILIGILGFVASFAASLGPVMWVLLSEIFPNDMRAIAMAATGLFNSGTSFFVQFLFPRELTLFGSAGTFLSFAALSLVGLVLVTWLLPETKGKSLEELEAEFGKRS